VNIFICTHFGDLHAIATQYALEKAGHNVFRWIAESSTDTQKHSILFDGTENSYNLLYDETAVNLESFDVIWWRRMNDITLSSNINDGDRDFAVKEWRAVYDALPMLFRHDARWINSWRGRRLADMKLLQLKEAQSVGLQIPQTLVSNNAEDIRAFASNHVDGIVHKMFEPAAWRNDSVMVRSRTRRVLPSHLENSLTLSLCPGVFQQRITKVRELRATFMGEEYLCVAIEPKDDPDGVCDWRSIPIPDRKMVMVDLPTDIVQRCHALMKKLDISFGCFDLLVTENDQYIFLEVNENGQFLWIEQDNPEIKMLNKFCEFLVGADCDTPALKDIFGDDEFLAMFKLERDGTNKRFAMATKAA
jgi:glutathione synthase/RimK-type ligase-like ATP-grasp enzyme